MKRSLLAAAMLVLSGPPLSATAQDAQSEYISCLTASEMSGLFQSGETSRLPNYSESAGARVQRQYPTTLLIAQAKFIDWDNKPAAICQYSNHVGIVANFLFAGPTADASDGACDDGSCAPDTYWRAEWAETSEKDDRPGKEKIYVCVKDVDGAAYPSAGCNFIRPK